MRDQSSDIVDACLVQGTLVVVVGKVGCGKSSLLAALTGELSRCAAFKHLLKTFIIVSFFFTGEEMK